MTYGKPFGNKQEIRKKFYLEVFKKMVWGDNLTPEDERILTCWKETFKPNEIFLDHYSKKGVLFEIVKYLGNNELVIGENIRHLYAAKISSLIYNFYFYRMFEAPKSMYRGLSGFDNRPKAPFNIKNKIEWQRKYWTGGEMAYLKFVNSYNFGMDLDAETFEQSYADAKKVFDLFRKFDLKFSVWCSGKKGWHFIIPYDEFKNMIEPFKLGKTIECCKALMVDIVSLLNLETVDHKIYSPTRYLKCVFTIDKRNNNVILPLTDKEFLDFKENSGKYMSPEYCHKLPRLGFIGAYSNRKSNLKGFEEFADYLETELK